MQISQQTQVDLPVTNEDGVIVAAIPGVFFNCWVKSPTVARLDRLAAIQKRVTEQQGRHSVISLVDPATGRELDPAARKRAGEVGNLMNGLTTARLFIVLGSGFYAAMVRTAISGVLLLAKDTSPYQVVTDAEAGMSWLDEAARKGGVPFDGRLARQRLQAVLDARTAT